MGRNSGGAGRITPGRNSLRVGDMVRTRFALGVIRKLNAQSFTLEYVGGRDQTLTRNFRYSELSGRTGMRGNRELRFQ